HIGRAANGIDAPADYRGGKKSARCRHLLGARPFVRSRVIDIDRAGRRGGRSGVLATDHVDAAVKYARMESEPRTRHWRFGSPLSFFCAGGEGNDGERNSR